MGVGRKTGAFLWPFLTLFQKANAPLTLGRCLSPRGLSPGPLNTFQIPCWIKNPKRFLSLLLLIGVLLQMGRGTLGLRPFLFFQTQNSPHVDLIVLGGCYFLSTIRKGMDIGVTLQKAAISYKPIQANFLLHGHHWSQQCYAGQGNLAVSIMKEAITYFGTFIKAVNVILKLNCKTFKVLFNEMSELLAVANNGIKIQRANVVKEMWSTKNIVAPLCQLEKYTKFEVTQCQTPAYQHFLFCAVLWGKMLQLCFVEKSGFSAQISNHCLSKMQGTSEQEREANSPVVWALNHKPLVFPSNPREYKS